MPKHMPTLFVSHGAPSLLVDRDPTFDFFKRLGGILPRPKAILCISAHWERYRLAASGSPRTGTIHDFYGFADELYDMRYPCPGDPALAESVQSLMAAAACACDIDEQRGLDHGAWILLTLMYPDADIPVVQLALQKGAGTAQHLWPLFVPLGAAGKGATGQRLFDGYTYGILSMAAYAWGL